MVRPASFGFNAETAVNNLFQQKNAMSGVSARAVSEFDRLAELLQAHGIRVTICADSAIPVKPDAIFPNNWISFHGDSYMLYPMYAANRRTERREEIVQAILADRKKDVKCIDLSRAEDKGFYLEGTGSLVLDRTGRKVYASLSERTSEALVEEWSLLTGYRPVIFRSSQEVAGKRMAIYHTNVMLSVGTGFVAVCADCIDQSDRSRVLSELAEGGREIILLTEDQMAEFAGNMLEVRNEDGETFVVMSSRAHASLSDDQVMRISSYAQILHSSLEVIETCGGGSARCMLAEIF